MALWGACLLTYENTWRSSNMGSRVRMEDGKSRTLDRNQLCQLRKGLFKIKWSTLHRLLNS